MKPLIARRLCGATVLAVVSLGSIPALAVQAGAQPTEVTCLTSATASDQLPPAPCPPGNPSIVAFAVTSSGVSLSVTSSGAVFNGTKGQVQGMNGQPLAAPVVGIAVSGTGYSLAAADGGVFSLDGAAFYGSMGGHHLNAPIVGIASTADGKGYWLVAADGGSVFPSATPGSTARLGGKPLSQPMVGMALYPRVAMVTGWSPRTAECFPSATPSSTARWVVNTWVLPSSASPLRRPPASTFPSYPAVFGYWMVASDGKAFSFGDTPCYCSGADVGDGAAIGISAFSHHLDRNLIQVPLIATLKGELLAFGAF